MIPALIGTAASLASSIYSGVSLKNNQAATNALYDTQAQRLEDQFNTSYYQDFMQSSQMQSLLSNLRSRSSDATQAAANTATVMGATPEAIAATKKNEAKVYGETVNQLAANGYAQQQQALTNYQNASNNLEMGRINSNVNYMNQQSQNMAQGISSFGNSLGGIVSAYQKK